MWASAQATMNRAEFERQLRWLMILRVVTVTTLLISAFAIELTLKPGQTLRPLFLLSAVIYGMCLLYALLDRWLKGTSGAAEGAGHAERVQYRGTTRRQRPLVTAT